MSRDRTPPKLEVGGPTIQRLGRSGVIRLAATSSEPGTIAASGSLDIAGLARPLLSPRARVPVAGGGVELEIRLTRRQLAEVRRALGRGRRVRVRLGVVATDVAGNSVQARAPLIRLLR
jgi:hypothetical protein